MQEKNNSLQIFNYEEDCQVRVIEQDNELWFVAKDVCDILGLANVTEALRSLDDDEKGFFRISEGTSTKGGNPNMAIITESGVYALVFKSRKFEAKNFSRWVRREVLPSIRKTGVYSINPDTIKYMITRIQQLQEENRRMKHTIDESRPKTALGSIVYAMSGAVTVQDAANFLRQKGIPIGQNLLYRHLRDKKLLCSRKGSQWNKPTSKAMQAKFFNIEITNLNNNCAVTVKVTPKLLSKLAEEFMQKYFPLIYEIDKAEQNDN